MPTPFAEESTLAHVDQEVADKQRCYGCFRRLTDCFCAAIPSIDNQTEVLILQHMRERFHPFNTARIVRKALRNSRLLADHTRPLADALALKPRAGLLYPGPGAMLLEDLPANERPEQLVILDGTWHHAKTFMRDIPALHPLPRYRLAPSSPSLYRIRREPTALSLSTVEATVAALRVLEPDLRGLDQLMDAFLTMVDRQVAHPKSQHGWRHKEKRVREFKNIPVALRGDLNHVVVAYGESASREPGDDDVLRRPIYWVAERVGTGERFRCAIRPQSPLQDSFLGHLELTPADFDHASSLEQAREAWSAFLRPDDILAVYNQGVIRLHQQISTRSIPALVLKSVDFNPRRRYGTLDELLLGEGKTAPPPQLPGRAGKRLSNVLALVLHLNALGNVTACRSS